MNSFLYLFAAYMANAARLVLTDYQYCRWVQFVLDRDGHEKQSIFLLWALFLEKEGLSVTVDEWNRKDEN